MNYSCHEIIEINRRSHFDSFYLDLITFEISSLEIDLGKYILDAAEHF